MRGYFSLKLATYLCSVVCLGIMATRAAHAYIDPGTGSYLLQMLAAGILAALFVIKAFWRNLRDGFSRLVVRRRKE